MTISPSAVSRVVGIETKFQDLRAGGVLFLPQRIVVLAHGASAAVYGSEKFQPTSSAAVGNRMGFRSQAYNAVREFLPVNGDGVGTIPVTVIPLSDAPGSTAAAGDITPSGTATKATSVRLRVGGVLTGAFVIPAGAVSVTNLCGLMGDVLGAELSVPATVSYNYGTVTSTPGTNTGNGTVTALSAPGTPRPGAWVLTLITAVTNGGVFKLVDPLGATASTTITMTPGAGGATVITTAGLQFTITDGSTDFAVADKFTITVPATRANLTAAWKGETGNDIKIEVIGDTAGVVFAITQPTGGLVNPDVTPALAQIGNVWETLVLNGMPISDTTTLDKIQAVGEGRWSDVVRKPFVAFTGNTAKLVADATVVSSARRTDRVNCQLVAPGSVNLPIVVAARQLARIAVIANENPPTGYGSQRATGLLPGADSDQWDYAAREQAELAGSSTIQVKDGVVNISDVVTFYRPTGEDPPAYRQVVHIIRLQNVIFNFDLEFTKPEWDGAPLIPDDQPTVNPRARKPRSAKTAMFAILDGLGKEAIISAPGRAKKNTFASINSQNPDRLDLSTTIQLSGNTNIISATLNFGFFFGAQVAA